MSPVSNIVEYPINSIRIYWMSTDIRPKKIHTQLRSSRPSLCPHKTTQVPTAMFPLRVISGWCGCIPCGERWGSYTRIDRALTATTQYRLVGAKFLKM